MELRTLREHLSYDGWDSENIEVTSEQKAPLENYKKVLEEVKKAGFDYDNRDTSIQNLIVELFQKAGLPSDEKIPLIEEDWDTEEIPEIPNSGWVFVIEGLDDPIYVIYHDGDAKAAFYASFRGIYQAGGYIKEGAQHFFASDFVDNEPHNEWIPSQRICSKIARDAIIGEQSDS